MRTFSAISSAALLLGQVSTVWAAPPAGHSPTNSQASRSPVQRALDSRAGLMQRANVRAQGSTAGGSNISAGSNGLAQSTANANGNAVANANASAAFVGNGTASLNADANANDHGQAGRANATPNPQSGTGHLPREIVSRRLENVRGQPSVEVRNSLPREIGQVRRDDAPGRPESQSSGGAPDRRPNRSSSRSRPTAAVNASGSGRAEMVAHGQNRLALTNADRLLAHRLAQADRMRDEALETGNDQLLERADKIDQLARWQHAGRLEGRLGKTEYPTNATEDGEASTPIRHPFRRMHNPDRPTADTAPPENTDAALPESTGTAPPETTGSDVPTASQTNATPETTVDTQTSLGDSLAATTDGSTASSTAESLQQP